MEKRLTEPSYASWVAMMAFIVAIYPFIFLAFWLFPLRLMGLNLYLGIVTFGIYAFFLVNLKGKMPRPRMTLIFGILGTFIITLLTRYIVLDEPLNELAGYRIGLSPLICAVVATYTVNRKTKSIFSDIIIYAAMVQAAFGITHYYFFPELKLGITASGYEGVRFSLDGRERESGFYENPSLYANMILLGLIVLVKEGNSSRLIRKQFAILCCAALLVYAILLSGSRYPGIVGLFVFLYYFAVLVFRAYAKMGREKRILLFLICGFVVWKFATLILPEIESLFLRLMRQGMSIRTIKNELAASVLFGDWTNMFVGEKLSIFGNTKSLDGTGISDNSFFELGVRFGVLYVALLGISLFFYLVLTTRLNLPFFLLLSYFLINLYLTNAIYWDIYMLYFFLVLYIFREDGGSNFLFKLPALEKSKG